MMEKIKYLIIIYFMTSCMLLGQDYKLENLLSQIATNGEIAGFVENCDQPKIFPKIPIIPPILSNYKLKTSSNYGYRIHPISHTLKFHAGIDLATTETDTLIATADGVISQIGHHPDLGNFICIQHQYGFMALYGHLSIIFVKPNQQVSVGQAIGLMGNSGMVTGKHLHYCLIKNGFYLNPVLVMYLFLKVKTQKNNDK